MKILQWMSAQKGRMRFWVATGPLLVIASLCMPLVKIRVVPAVFPFVMMLGLFFIWRAKVLGSLLTVLMVVITLLLGDSSLPSGFSWLFMGSLTVSLIVFGLSLSEGEEGIVKNERSLSNALADLEEEQRKSERVHFDEKIDSEKRCDDLNLEMKKAFEEVESYKHLVEASQQEAEKYYAQNVKLLEETLLHHREDNAKDEMVETLSRLEQKNKVLQKALNESRVEAFQKEVLVEDFQKNKVSEKKEGINPEAVLLLETLHDERLSVKKQYETGLEAYSQLSQQLNQMLQQKEPSPVMVTQVGGAFEQKTEELASCRMRIFKLEGEMLKTQKLLGKESLSEEEGYLAIADGECHRLERENHLLMDMLKQMAKKQS